MYTHILYILHCTYCICPNSRRPICASNFTVLEEEWDQCLAITASVLENQVQLWYKTLSYRHRERTWEIIFSTWRTALNTQQGEITAMFSSTSVSQILRKKAFQRSEGKEILQCRGDTFCPHWFASSSVVYWSKHEEWVHKETRKWAISSNAMWNARLIHISAFLLSNLKTPIPAWEALQMTVFLSTDKAAWSLVMVHNTDNESSCSAHPPCPTGVTSSK